MSFESLMRDRVSVLKADGSRTDDLPANVTSTKISIHRSQPLIEPGDLVLRKSSNGAEETYRVIDPNFREAFHGIPARYELKVQKLGLPEARSAVQSITYNVTGSNARINHHSIDNSINTVVGNSSVGEQLAALREAVCSLRLPPGKQQEAIEIADAVGAQFAGGAPKRSIISALLAALPQAANVATIASAILAFAQ